MSRSDEAINELENKLLVLQKQHTEAQATTELLITTQDKLLAASSSAQAVAAVEMMVANTQKDAQLQHLPGEMQISLQSPPLISLLAQAEEIELKYVTETAELERKLAASRKEASEIAQEKCVIDLKIEQERQLHEQAIQLIKTQHEAEKQEWREVEAKAPQMPSVECEVELLSPSRGVCLV